MSERTEFAKRFDAVEKEVLVLTESGTSASRWGKNKLWRANAEVLAWVDVATGELVKETSSLEWQMTDEECQKIEKVFNIKGETIYRLKVQESLPFTNLCTGEMMKQGYYLWVKEVLERNCKETRLEEILEMYQNPVVIRPKGCKKLTLDKSVGTFSGKGSWNGAECLVHLDVDREGAETAKDSRGTLKKLLENCQEWDEKARRFAAEKLTANANDWAKEEDENAKEITQEEFAKRLIISEVCVSTKGYFELFYEDDDMFWGHVVIVSGNIENGIDDAVMAGLVLCQDLVQNKMRGSAC